MTLPTNEQHNHRNNNKNANNNDNNVTIRSNVRNNDISSRDHSMSGHKRINTLHIHHHKNGYRHLHEKGNQIHHNSVSMSSNIDKRMSHVVSSNGDLEYCKELSRRSVARAALHLGVDGMSADALDVMGDVLIHYLRRIGTVLAKNVQSTKRTSAHCNVLDALDAIDLCTSPAAQQIHPNESTSTSTSTSTTTGWKGLATFLYGPKWSILPPSTTTTMTSNVVIPEPVVVGGKQLPSSALLTPTTTTTSTTVNNNKMSSHPDTTSPNNTTDKIEEGGWNAPFLDHVPYFPYSIHPNKLFSKSITQSFHNNTTIQSSQHNHTSSSIVTFADEACRDDINNNSYIQSSNNPTTNNSNKNHLVMNAQNKLEQEFIQLIGEQSSSSPNALYDGIQQFWGITHPKKQITTANNTTTASTTTAYPTTTTATTTTTTTTTGGEFPPLKRVKLDPSLLHNKNNNATITTINHANKNSNDAKKEEEEDRTAHYVPSFLPPFPPEQTYDMKEHVVGLTTMSNFLTPLSSQTTTTTTTTKNYNNNHLDDSSNNINNLSSEQQIIISEKQKQEELLNYMTTTNPYKIRSSLIELNKNSNTNDYWGSMTTSTTTTTTTLNMDKIQNLVVPSGPIRSKNHSKSMNSSNLKSSSSNNGKSSSSNNSSNNISGVVPLHRMSSSRVGRILEGSMDSAFP